jgi:hypothetical protein
MSHKKIVTIDLDQYGGTGTWTGPITVLPRSGLKGKNSQFSTAKTIKHTPKKPYNKGGYAKKMRTQQKK